VIRQRLFSKIDYKKVEKIVRKFVEYAEFKNILPTGMQPTEYGDRFLDSYPFLREVIDVLYLDGETFPIFKEREVFCVYFLW
jgi:predicted AAA+ superfamily ATPase